MNVSEIQRKYVAELENKVLSYTTKIEQLESRVKELEKELFNVNAHNKRLIESAMAAWERVDDQ